MDKRGLGRDQVHEAAWGHEAYPHPLVSCMMPFIAIIATVALGLFGFTLWGKMLPGEVAIPDVIGLPQAQAEQILQQTGLSVTVLKDRAPSETIASGSVLTIIPKVGRKVRQGRLIRLQISDVSQYAVVPEVVNHSQEEAHRFY